VCIGIIPQTTCSFLTINPSNITSYPDDYPLPATGPANVAEEEDAAQAMQQQQQQQQQQTDIFFPWNAPLPERNITSTAFTVNLGPWLVGSDEIDGVCYPLSNALEASGAPPPDPSLLAARAFGIVASIAGSAAVVAALVNCRRDDAGRRRWNRRCVAWLYAAAAVATWLTFLIANIAACRGAERNWIKPGPLQGLTLQYGRCICRAGCFLTMAVGFCYMAATVCVLLYSG
jgi:hypothetical protein